MIDSRREAAPSIEINLHPVDDVNPISGNEDELRQSVRLRSEQSLPHKQGAAQIDRFRGCLLAGAIGDALGAPVEFMSHQEILASFGPSGITELVPAYGRLGAITDDTQMTLFTAEGLLRAAVRARLKGIGPVYASVTDYAYARWLMTQGETPGMGGRPLDGWLISHRELFEQRAPGNTCLSALRAKKRAGDPARNDSKGCGGVMRVAPVGLLFATQANRYADASLDKQAFDLGSEIASLTHGHPTGQIPAGYLSVLIAVLASGGSWDEATARSWAQLVQVARHEETSVLVARALLLAAETPFTVDRLTQLGQGWIAEEALAISLYCVAGALATLQDPSMCRTALLRAVNHGGDSDSTGSISGYIIGAIVGVSGLPDEWLKFVELREVAAEVAEDLATLPVWLIGDYVNSVEEDYWWQRYPGG